MFDRIGAFFGDKIGAVQGKLRADRYRLTWPGRKRRAIARARRRGAEMGGLVGKITGWTTAGFRWVFGWLF